MTYTIAYPADEPRALTVVDTTDDPAMRADTYPEGHVAHDVETEEDLRRVGGAVLVLLYNRAVTQDQRVKRFETTTAGARRVFPHLAALARPGAAPAEKPSIEFDVDPDPDPQTRAIAPRGRRSAFEPDHPIRVLVTENPKRPGTAAHARFALYRDGLTVREFLAAGGTGADLTWDVAHGHVAVGP